MSFVDCEGIMMLIENLLAYSWPQESGELIIPFKHMKYEDAMELYGTDKPDLRIPQQVRFKYASNSNSKNNFENSINISAL